MTLIDLDAAVEVLEAYLTPYRGTIDTGSIHRNGVIVNVVAALRSLPTQPEEGIPRVVKIAIRVLINHTEPGWENCTALVREWLDGVDHCAKGGGK
jgi:hypothetical protein